MVYGWYKLNNQPPINYSYDNRAVMPQNELQFNMLTTNSSWGEAEMNPEVQAALSEYEYTKTENGNIEVTVKKNLWNRLSIYTRDVRLGNLEGEEYEEFQSYMDLANILLSKDFFNSASTALGFAVTIIESSQSKKGFLRRRMNTLTSEHINRDLEPPKKKLFGQKENTGM